MERLFFFSHGSGELFFLYLQVKVGLIQPTPTCWEQTPPLSDATGGNDTVDSSEIPFPSTVWMYKTLYNNGIYLPLSTGDCRISGCHQLVRFNPQVYWRDKEIGKNSLMK